MREEIYHGNYSQLGFPRVGKKRELKFALERYWRVISHSTR
ncbi:hypothetical protein [Pseudoalteromonas luteoviolacea]